MRIFQKIKSLQLSSTSLTALVALYFAVVMNIPFYRHVLSVQPLSGDPKDYFLFTVPFFIFFGLNIAFQLLAWPYLHKIIFPLLLVISAVVGYNEWAYGVFFDNAMLANVLQTHTAEALNLLTLPYVLSIIFFGVIPAFLYVMVKVRYQTVAKEILWRAGSIFVSLLFIFGIAKVFYQDYASFSRNNKPIVHLLLPSNFIQASVSTAKGYYNAHRAFEHVALDAKQEKQDQTRQVVVLVMGETTRAQNWGLNGYGRQTTPLLAQRHDVVNFSNVTSCGTATAHSIPCIFSNLGRTEFNNNAAPYRDNLLDILQRAGVNVDWYENDSGCKGVCERVPHVDVTSLNLPEYCRDGECLDEILLKDLQKAIDKSDQDTFIILHTIGSHGPTYYERYPEAYRRFTPTCDTKQINECTDEQLVNTYDNTILYIDYIVNKTIDIVNSNKDIAGSVIYVSDHGESLGENGIYMHSTPYSIAPKEQTHVPMVMWFSPLWKTHAHVDIECLQQVAKTQEYSHDNLFHSIAAMFSVNNFKEYRDELNVLHACKKP